MGIGSSVLWVQGMLRRSPVGPLRFPRSQKLIDPDDVEVTESFSQKAVAKDYGALRRATPQVYDGAVPRRPWLRKEV